MYGGYYVVLGNVFVFYVQVAKKAAKCELEHSFEFP